MSINPTPCNQPTKPPGTPLQNNLAELWSLLNYLLPDIFSNLADFESWFDIASSVVGGGEEDAELVAAEQRAAVVDKLHSLLKPFLLRRIKADVEIALPRKQELLLYAPMTALQKQLNQQLLERSLAVRVEQGEGASALAQKRCFVLCLAARVHEPP
jgi:ATP-dependent DNA helicase